MQRMAEAMARAGKRVLVCSAKGNVIMERVDGNTIRVSPAPAPPQPTVYVDDVEEQGARRWLKPPA